eukprot:jgi/Mesvir1/8512/Mv09810-RA.1
MGDGEEIRVFSEGFLNLLKGTAVVLPLAKVFLVATSPPGQSHLTPEQRKYHHPKCNKNALRIAQKRPALWDPDEVGGWGDGDGGKREVGIPGDCECCFGLGLLFYPCHFCEGKRAFEFRPPQIWRPLLKPLERFMDTSKVRCRVCDGYGHQKCLCCDASFAKPPMLPRPEDTPFG